MLTTLGNDHNPVLLTRIGGFFDDCVDGLRSLDANSPQMRSNVPGYLDHDNQLGSYITPSIWTMVKP